jgi:hypothetical protein
MRGRPGCQAIPFRAGSFGTTFPFGASYLMVRSMPRRFITISGHDGGTWSGYAAGAGLCPHVRRGLPVGICTRSAVDVPCGFSKGMGSSWCGMLSSDPRQSHWCRALLTGGDNPFIAPCCLHALSVQYRRAEPQWHLFSALDVGLSCGCSGRGPWPQWPLASVV